jgi:hypothetical protein
MAAWAKTALLDSVAPEVKIKSSLFNFKESANSSLAFSILARTREAARKGDDGFDQSSSNAFL